MREKAKSLTNAYVLKKKVKTNISYISFNNKMENGSYMRKDHPGK